MDNNDFHEIIANFKHELEELSRKHGCRLDREPPEPNYDDLMCEDEWLEYLEDRKCMSKFLKENPVIGAIVL